MPLTDPQKTNLRRHLQVPVAGLPLISPAGGTMASGNAGYRYFDAWGQLEFRMNNLNADEEARLLGQTFGSFALTGPAVVGGTTFSIQVSGGGLAAPVTISYTSVATDTQITVMANLAALINGNANLLAAGFMCFNPYGYGAFSQTKAGGAQTGNPAVPLAQIGILNKTPGVTSFALAVPGSTVPQIIAPMQGQLLAPQATMSLVTNPPTVLNGYLPICDWLEGAIAGATMNLDTSRADVWYPRMDEVEAREDLYKLWTKRLGDFLFGKDAWTGPRGAPGGSYQIKGCVA